MLLQVENLHFQFGETKKVLDGASFALEAGRLYALMGSNGAGKTTLFNLLEFEVEKRDSYKLGDKNKEIFVNNENPVNLAPTIIKTFRYANV